MDWTSSCNWLTLKDRFVVGDLVEIQDHPVNRWGLFIGNETILLLEVEAERIEEVKSEEKFTSESAKKTGWFNWIGNLWNKNSKTSDDEFQSNTRNLLVTSEAASTMTESEATNASDVLEMPNSESAPKKMRVDEDTEERRSRGVLSNSGTSRRLVETNFLTAVGQKLFRINNNSALYHLPFYMLRIPEEILSVVSELKECSFPEADCSDECRFFALRFRYKAVNLELSSEIPARIPGGFSSQVQETVQTIFPYFVGGPLVALSVYIWRKRRTMVQNARQTAPQK